jgi:hypothetical protein
MNDQHDSIATAVGKSILAIGAWFGSIQLAEVQTWIGIASGLAVFVYTTINIYIAWRDKLRNKP